MGFREVSAEKNLSKELRRKETKRGCEAENVEKTYRLLLPLKKGGGEMGERKENFWEILGATGRKSFQGNV